MSRGKSISQEELDYIKVNLLQKSVGEIANDLGRNYYTIYRISRGFGISRNHEFTPQEDAYIRKHYSDMSAIQIAGRLKIDVEMVYNRARKLGVRKNKKR